MPGPSPGFQLHSNGNRLELISQFHPHQQPMPVAYNNTPQTQVLPSTTLARPIPPITAEEYFHEEYKRREVSKHRDQFPPDDQLEDFLHKKWIEASELEHQSWNQDYEERLVKYNKDIEEYHNSMRGPDREVELEAGYGEDNGEEERDDDVEMEGEDEGAEERRGGVGGFTAVNG